MSIHMAGDVESFDAMAGLENWLFAALGTVIAVLVVLSVLRFRGNNDVLGFVFMAIASALLGFLAFAGYFVGLSRAPFVDSLQWLLAFAYIGRPMVTVCFVLVGILLLAAAIARMRRKRHG